jgi:hypothetical protein
LLAWYQQVVSCERRKAIVHCSALAVEPQMAHLQPVLLALPAMQHIHKISTHHPIHILFAARKLLDANTAHGHGMCTQSSSTSRTLKPHLHSSSHASRLDLEKGRFCIPLLWNHHHHHHRHLWLSMLLFDKFST